MSYTDLPVGSSFRTIGAELEAELDPESGCQLPFTAPQLGPD